MAQQRYMYLVACYCHRICDWQRARALIIWKRSVIVIFLYFMSKCTERVDHLWIRIYPNVVDENMRFVNRGRLLLLIYGPVPLWDLQVFYCWCHSDRTSVLLYLKLMLNPISHELVLFPDFWVSNIPRYFCFFFSYPHHFKHVCDVRKPLYEKYMASNGFTFTEFQT